MSAHFFHTLDSQGVIADEEGMTLAGLRARDLANLSMTETVARRISSNQSLQDLAMGDKT